MDTSQIFIGVLEGIENPSDDSVTELVLLLRKWLSAHGCSDIVYGDAALDAFEIGLLYQKTMEEIEEIDIT